MKRLFYILGILVLFINPYLFCRENLWVNPGVKFGYRFGSGGGFIVGMEVSVVWEGYKNFTGVVFALDRCSAAKMTRINISFERINTTDLPVGYAIGPTIIFSESKKHWGVTTSMYGGLFLIPYLSTTFNFDDRADFELGSFIKIPILYSGPGIM